MPAFRVSYMGLPDSERLIEASSPEIAARLFFTAAPKANAVLVERKWRPAKIFPAHELAPDCPDVDAENLKQERRERAPEELDDQPTSSHPRLARIGLTAIGLIFAGLTYEIAREFSDLRPLAVVPALVSLVAWLFAALASDHTIARFFSHASGRRHPERNL